jgi:regulator of cell morphogenesis and NO signaling
VSTIDLERTVGELVAERPGRARVFERLGLDYCCGGGKPLVAACADAGLDAAEVAASLERAEAAPPGEETDWRSVPLGDLCDHIVERHHGYLREELPRLGALMEKVARAHGGAHPELHEVASLLAEVTAELSRHIGIEEGALFPACRRLEETGVSGFETLAAPISVMESDHDAAGDALASMRSLTAGFTPPAGACNSYRALLDGLEALELDLHRHIHEENNVLFPRALALEASS